MRRWRAGTGLLLLVALLGSAWAGPGGGPAGDKGKDKDKDKDKDKEKDRQVVEVEVWAIRATTKNSDISKELEDLAKVLKKQFKYTGFKQEKTASKKDVSLGKDFSTDLIGNYKVAITPKELKEESKQKRIKLDVAITRHEGKEDKKVLNTTVTIEAGALLPIGCGPLEDGDYLIIAVRAR